MRILARQPDFRFVIPYVLFHHEHWNGGGYPFGRRRDEIPLEARVLAVADAFDAMTSPRPYGPPLPVDEALAEIERCAGTQFDPLVAGVFVELCRAAPPRLLAAQG
jgi:HD-GYP domain-containing protein (c-di-GMP phosphodiesterase class II)